MALLPYLGYNERAILGYFLRYHIGVPSPHWRIPDTILCWKVWLKNWFFRALLGSWFWHSSPIGILVQNGSKVSFLLVEWEKKEKKWTSIDIWRNIRKRRFAIFTTITGTIGKLTTQPIFVLRYIKVAIIANLVSRIYLQISIDVHFFSFSFHSTSKKETFEPYKSKIAIGELCHNEDRNMG